MLEFAQVNPNLEYLVKTFLANYRELALATAGAVLWFKIQSLQASTKEARDAAKLAHDTGLENAARIDDGNKANVAILAEVGSVKTIVNGHSTMLEVERADTAHRKIEATLAASTASIEATRLATEVDKAATLLAAEQHRAEVAARDKTIEDLNRQLDLAKAASLATPPVPATTQQTEG